MPRSPERWSSLPAQVRAAFAARAEVHRQRGGHAGEPSAVVLPLEPGRGLLVRRAERDRLVSLADGSEPDRPGALGRALMRRQARRSALILVRERAAGIRLAGAWRVDLATVRVVAQSEDLNVAARRHLARTAGGGRPWHTGGR